jgi:hypothetical protein
MLVGMEWNLASRSPDSISKAIAAVVKPIPGATLKAAMDRAVKAYESLGDNDVIAKAHEMTKVVLSN